MTAPTGTVTFLFTDLVSSTETLTRLGDDAAEPLRRTHFRILREAVAEAGGHEVKNLGDGLMVAFPSAITALECAISMQRKVTLHNRSGAELLEVRIGLNVGEPILDESDYFGSAVVIAKRLCDQAQGGQIIASQLVRGLIGSRGSFRFTDLGPLILKGLSEPVSACEVLWEPAVDEPTASPPLPASLLGGERTPFVGREAALSTLLDAWERTKSGQRQLVLLSGEPGIGKTRLATEFAQTAHAEGASVLLGRCDEELALPYMPFVEALRQFFASLPSGGSELMNARWGEDLARLIPEARPAGPPEPTPVRLDPEVERFRLYDAIDQALIDIAASEPLVLLLEDLHWADKASLLLLRHLLRSPAPAPILFFGTYRETDLARTHPLAEMLGDFRRAPSFQHLHLGGLSLDDTAALIDAWAGHETSVNFPEAIHAATEGNPFFIQEVLRHLAETGVITPQEDGWTTAAIEDMGIPEGIREVIDRRLSHLSEDANAALSAASVFGREFDVGPLEAVTALPAERLLLSLEEARAAGLIDEAGAMGGYRFGHALIREALYTALSGTRRARLHGRIAEVLEAGYGRKAASNAARLANHYLQAGTLSQANVLKAAHYSRLAAEQAEAATAWAEAARHYDDCLTLVTNSEEAPSTGSGQALGEDEAALLLALGRCLRYEVQPRAAWRSLMRATTIYRERGDGAGMARAALEADEIEAPRERLGALAEEALKVLGESDLLLRARLLLMRAGREFDDASKAAAAEAERIAQTLGNPALLGGLAYRQAREAAGEKRMDEAVSLFRRARVLLDEGAEHGRAAVSLWEAAARVLGGGKLDEGVAVANDALAYARQFHIGPQEIACLGLLLSASLIRCDFPQFDSILSENEVPAGAVEIPMLRAARAEMGGDLDAALELAPALDAPGGYTAVNLPQVLGSLARMAFNAGHEDEARKYLEAWSSGLGLLSARMVSYRIGAIAELDECLPALGDESLVRRVSEELNEWRILRYAPHDARGPDRIRGALALRLKRIDEAEGWYHLGLEWAKQEGCPVEEGRCLQGLAEVAARRRRRREALRLLDEASVLFEAHGAKLYLDRAHAARDALIASAHGPIKPLPPAYPGGLSEREVEVLRLIAAGKSNAQVAGLLVISLNTVERHVNHILTKSGAGNRVELALFAQRSGLLS